MNGKPGLIFTLENVTNQVAGEYRGYARFMEGGNGLGSDAEAYENLMCRNEATVFIRRIRRREVNIHIQIKGLPDISFQNNFLFKDPSSEKFLIEGDWLVEWGIIGSLDMENAKLIIDVNPFNYLKTKNSRIRSDWLKNRYVIQEPGKPHNYKTVFNLEFDGTKSY